MKREYDIMELDLAPMKGITCWAFRASVIGATDSYTEYINLKSLLNIKAKGWDKVDTYSIAGQRQWLQILTHDIRDISIFPKILKEFCLTNPERAHIYGININAGCPDPAVITAGDGAALIKRIKRLKELIQAFIGEPNSHAFQIGVKLRLGLNEREMNYNKVLILLEELKSLEDPRIAPLIVHFKHAKQTSKEPPHWEFLESFINADIPFIINGSIKEPKDIEQIQKKISSGSRQSWDKIISGIMIGREAIRNPECFNLFEKNLRMNDDKSWNDYFIENLKFHPPKSQFIANFRKLYSMEL